MQTGAGWKDEIGRGMSEEHVWLREWTREVSCSSRATVMQFKEPELQDSTIRKVLGLSTTSPTPSPQPHSGQLAL